MGHDLEPPNRGARGTYCGICRQPVGKKRFKTCSDDHQRYDVCETCLSARDHNIIINFHRRCRSLHSAVTISSAATQTEYCFFSKIKILNTRQCPAWTSRNSRLVEASQDQLKILLQNLDATEFNFIRRFFCRRQTLTVRSVREKVPWKYLWRVTGIATKTMIIFFRKTIFEYIFRIKHPKTGELKTLPLELLQQDNLEQFLAVFN